MFEKVYEKAIDYLYFNFNDEDNFSEDIDFFEIVRATNNLYKLNFIKEADKFFIFLLSKFDTDCFFRFNEKTYSSVFLLETLCLKFSKNSFKKDNRENKKILKLIEKIILKNFSHFDKNYFLIENKKEKKYFLDENLTFLKVSDDIIKIYSEYENLEIISKVEKLKEEIFLGINRYFFFEKQKILIKHFSTQNKNYKICNKYETLKNILIYNISEDFSKEFLETNLNEFLETNNNRVFLLAISGLKKLNNKNFSFFLSNKIKDISHFSEIVFKNKEDFLDINYKLFFDKSNFIEENDKIYYKVNDIEVINLVIEILKL